MAQVRDTIDKIRKINAIENSITNLSWESINNTPDYIVSTTTYVATAGETTFNISYEPGTLDCFLNGVRLRVVSDFTATNGTSITLSDPTEEGDILDLKAASGLIPYVNNTVATVSDIGVAINELIDASPGTLNTLNEIAAALGDDPNFATTITTQIGTKANQSTTYTKAEVDGFVNAKANQSSTYTKDEVDNALNLKAIAADTYNINQVNTALGLKANQSSTYTINQVDTALGLKANQSSTYTKAETDSKLGLKLNTAGGTITGNLNFGSGCIMRPTSTSLEICSTSTGTDYNSAALELRESNFTGTGSATPPRLGFHWGGVVASNISIASNGRIEIRNNPGTGFEDLQCKVLHGTATTAQYADLAEKYLPDDKYSAGTVLGIGGTNEVTLFKGMMKLAGVVSEKPGYMMNSELENGIYIALKGRVPCIINGSAEKGDYIIADDNGKGIAVKEIETIQQQNLLIGTALEDGTDLIEIKI